MRNMLNSVPLAMLSTLMPVLLMAAQNSSELYRSGVQLFESHQPEAAIVALRRSIAIQPENARAWQALGVVFAAQGDYEQAEEPFRNACERQPAPPGACVYYG